MELLSHQEEWDKNAENVIMELKQLFGNAAVDIQHVGSTAIVSIICMETALGYIGNTKRR